MTESEVRDFLRRCCDTLSAAYFVAGRRDVPSTSRAVLADIKAITEKGLGVNEIFVATLRRALEIVEANGESHGS